MKILIQSALLSTFTLIFSCSGKPGSTTSGKQAETPVVSEAEAAAKLITIVSPEENAGLVLNKPFSVVLKPESKNTNPDSIRIWFDGKLVTTLKQGAMEYNIPQSFAAKTGRKALKVVAYAKKGQPQTLTRFLIIYSDVAPKRYGYRTVKSYPHDREAFTQGLVFHDGILYEGTGQETRSSLRKVNLQTGEVLSQLNLESQLFGEGIAIKDDKIFQLTWRSKVGFVYDRKNFSLINKIYYQTEGWGLTTMGNDLVMSDGSNVLYLIDPETFTVKSTIEVYDNKKKVNDLNELEFISGEIWANIWQTDLIARIDPQSGKIIGYIDLKGILKDPDTDTTINVLNGIAFDSQTGRIFVTGKNWPKLFEIKVTE